MGRTGQSLLTRLIPLPTAALVLAGQPGGALPASAEPLGVQEASETVVAPPADEVSTEGATPNVEIRVEPANTSGSGQEGSPEGAGVKVIAVEERAGAKETKAIVHYTLANWYFYRWKLALAEVELQEAIMNWPSFKAAHRDLCLVSLFRGNFGQALAEMMMTVGLGDPIPFNQQEKWELNKRALQLHYKQGVENGRRGLWRDAVAEFLWCLTYDANDPVVRRSLAFAYSSLGEFGKAEQQYERTVHLDPSDAFARADFAFLLSDKGDKKRAMSQLSKAVQLAPSAAALHVDLGWMAETRGDLETAAAEFGRAIELSPKHAWLWARLGGILEKQGKSAEAARAYDKAVSLDADLSEAKQGLERLRAQAKAAS